MKLVHSEWDFAFEFQENTTQVLTIEKPNTYRELVLEMKSQCQGSTGGFVLSDKDKELIFSNKVALITDPLSLELNSRKALTSLYKIASSTSQDESHFLRTQEIKGALCVYLEELFHDFHYPIVVNQDFDIDKIFKVLNVGFDQDNNNLADCLLDYTKIMTELAAIQLFVFCEISILFNIKELSQLLSEWQYNKTPVLLIESREPLIDCNCCTWIIDGGDCLIEK